MKRPNALSLSPNTEFDDVALASKLILQPRAWRKDKFVNQFETDFEKIFENKFDATAVNSGRSALQIIIRALDLPRGSEVIVQAFTCIVVPNAILANNLVPIYADIDNTYNIDPLKLSTLITEKTRVVVVQHTFGVPADMNKIRNVISQKEKKFNSKIYLIEDCAHSLGSVYKNVMVGTLGDASFFSFGRDKMLSSVFGGMILTKNKKLQKNVKSIVSTLNYPSYYWVFQQLMHPIIFNTIILPFYNLGSGKVTAGKLLLFAFQKFRILSKPVYQDELEAKQMPLFPQKMSGALALLARKQLKKLNHYNNRRRKIVDSYFTNDIKPLSDKISDVVFLRYPINVDNAELLIQFARKHGVLLGDWYRNVLDPKCDVSVFGYKKGSCSHAEFLASRVVNLPTYPTMNQSDVDTVIQILKKWKSTQ